MSLSFSKYQGAGNDFILIDVACNPLRLDDALIFRLCDRRFGIGADGVLYIENNLNVRIFNADGSEALFCGNGIRCAFDYLARRLGQSKLHLTMGGRSFACRREGDAVAVALGSPKIVQWPALLDGMQTYMIDPGVPHALQFVEDLTAIDITAAGKRIRGSTGMNATFVRVDSKGSIEVRTYERGVEAETLACGSGAAAAAWAARRLFDLDDQIVVKTCGSDLVFSFIGDEVEMSGPAVFVFSGNLGVF